MPIGVGAATLIAGGAMAVGQVVSSKIGSNAAKDAGVIQGTAADNALTYEKERQARQDKIDEEKQIYDREQVRLQQQRRQPFVGAGTNAIARLNDTLGRSNHNTMGMGQDIFAPVPQPNIPPTKPVNEVGAAPGGVATPPQEGTVMMVAPTGERMPVPQSQVGHFRQRGATFVQ